jgi:hypothetical protein
MARRRSARHPAHMPDDAIETRVERVDAMTIDELRAEWRVVFGASPSGAVSKDLLARAIAYRLQEDAYGKLNAATARLLRSLSKPGVEPPRQIKVGSVLVREHKGVLHEVMVIPGGFCWRGETYYSLSIIAKKITGVSWNGPRFFGLRAKKKNDSVEEAKARCSPRQYPDTGLRTGARL